VSSWTDGTPGSDRAKRKGCLCPMMDNGYGRGRGDGSFVIVTTCPIHGDEKPANQPSSEVSDADS